MLVRIGVQFSVKEARELVRELHQLMDASQGRFLRTESLVIKLTTPLAEDVKVEAVPPQEGTHA